MQHLVGQTVRGERPRAAREGGRGEVREGERVERVRGGGDRAEGEDLDQRRTGGGLHRRPAGEAGPDRRAGAQRRPDRGAVQGFETGSEVTKDSQEGHG